MRDRRQELFEAAITQLNNLRQGMRDICDVVNIQNEDVGIWHSPNTLSEDYLQKELRKLHELIRDIAERNDLKLK